jgi:hypothetical protein
VPLGLIQLATQAWPSRMGRLSLGWQPTVESRGACLGGGGPVTSATLAERAGGEGGMEHHGEGVKLLRGSGDTGAHHVTLSVVAVTRSRALAATAWTQSRGGRPAVGSGSHAVRVGNSGR